MSENDIPIDLETNDLTSFLSNAAVETCTKLGTKAIITDTYTGRTTRYLSAYRGIAPIFSICYNERLVRQLALSYGVFPMYQEDKTGNTQQYFLTALKDLVQKNSISEEDSVCYLSGSYGMGLGTTFLEVNKVSNIFQSREKYLLPNF
jgi:pyruvate kinase